MGSSHWPGSESAHSDVSEAFRASFLTAADEVGVLRFDQFMQLALYHPIVGYYRRDQQRIGLVKGSDFFTASSSNPVFGELIAAACVTLLGLRTAADYTFVEIGAESEGGVLEQVDHPFASVRTLRIGESLELVGNCVVFSNELFDAQPFRRFVARDGAWIELGVQLRDDRLAEVELTTPAPSELPGGLPDGYRIDAPFAANELIQHIAAQTWNGLFVACDYGKSWQELTEACPAGTARAYFRHQQGNDLLARPGEQDLTCHICWDWLVATLKNHRFAKSLVESQESFFVRHAAESIAAISAAEALRFSRRKA